MVHTSRFYQYAYSYEEFRDNGLFSTEANCIQFLYDMKILRTHQKCPSCSIPMTLTECPLSKYRDGSCWKCTCGRTVASRVGSILQQSRIPLVLTSLLLLLDVPAVGRSRSPQQHQQQLNRARSRSPLRRPIPSSPTPVGRSRSPQQHQQQLNRARSRSALRRPIPSSPTALGRNRRPTTSNLPSSSLTLYNKVRRKYNFWTIAEVLPDKWHCKVALG